MKFQKGQSGNPAGSRKGNPALKRDHLWFKHLKIAAKREVERELPASAEEILKAAAEGRPVQTIKVKGPAMAMAADKMFELAWRDGNIAAFQHIAERFDGKVTDQVEITTNTSLKVRYESVDEVEEALREQGIDPRRLPLLTAPSDPKDLELVADEIEIEDVKQDK